MKTILILLLGVLLFSCRPPKVENTSALIDTLAIASHIEALSSDGFLGRKPFTDGEVKTIDYLKTQFELMGLEPGNGQSYLQEVPLVEIKGYPGNRMTISGGDKGDVELEVQKDYVVYTERVEERVSLQNSELVFAGYGIVAPEYNWNDYEGLDVAGKTVIVMVNDPGFEKGDSTFFKGETMTYYGRWTYKYEEAARQGAAGVLIIHETVPAGYPWMVVGASWSGGRLNLDKSGTEEYQCAVQGWITRDAAIRIFEASSVDMTDYKEKAQSAGLKSVPLGLNVSVEIQNEINTDNSFNVVAKITGSEKPEEAIIYTAHWDHLGVGTPVDGDSIYNGAHDNASGVATILGIARAFTQMEKPKRTLVFLMVTAEEQGLLGSAYYSSNPIFDPGKTVANLNIDGVNAYGKMKDFTVVGIGQSELEDIAEKYAALQDRYIYPDPEPGKGYFFRSDHFNFAKIGIPALFASGTYEAVEGGVDRIKIESETYNLYKYHKPADEFDASTWSFAGIYEDAELYLNIGNELANTDQWPKWKEGSEFKAIRESK